jgi:hypothetical protein
MTAPPPPLETPHFALLDRLVQRMARHDRVDARTREAVSLLTATADPRGADRLAVRAGEPPVLVERLAVWALKRVDTDAVARAAAVLEGRPVPIAAAPAGIVDDRVAVAC